MMEQDMNVLHGLTLSQRVAICFASGVVGASAVVLFSYVLFGLRISSALGVKAPIPLKSPDIYRPLFWGGLWGIPFGLHRGRLEVAIPLRLSLRPRAFVGAVSDLSAPGRRGVLWAS